MKTTFEKHCHVGAIFVDISKFFDKVWHEGLPNKLKLIITAQCIFDIISSFLSNRQFDFEINNEVSNCEIITAAVPQGSKLCLFNLFNLYVSDIPQSPHVLMCSYLLTIQRYTANLVV